MRAPPSQQGRGEWLARGPSCLPPPRTLLGSSPCGGRGRRLSIVSRDCQEPTSRVSRPTSLGARRCTSALAGCSMPPSPQVRHALRRPVLSSVRGIIVGLTARPGVCESPRMPPHWVVQSRPSVLATAALSQVASAPSSGGEGAPPGVMLVAGQLGASAGRVDGSSMGPMESVGWWSNWRVGGNS